MNRMNGKVDITENQISELKDRWSQRNSSRIEHKKKNICMEGMDKCWDIENVF